MRPGLRYLVQSAKLAIAGGTIGLGSFFIYTRHTKFSPVEDSDPLIKLVKEKGWNPHNNPMIKDLYVRRVPLEKIRPELRDSPVRLTRALCAGVWSNWGFSIQRAILNRSRNDTNRNHLWTEEELLSSEYNQGTLIADSFEVVEKEGNQIVIRGGDSPSSKSLRPLDAALELSAKINEHEQVVEFGFKSAFFAGDQPSEVMPMPGFAIWLHLQYAKLLLETGISNAMI